ncbi:MAG: hypothetical protein IJ232_06010 [Lachnospiraceae bacterium]|jgi:uncharacterized membrane protein HdeD (DUF308 family)|nr:hypothetical protein [Lachnospiraceae bacterium]
MSKIIMFLVGCFEIIAGLIFLFAVKFPVMAILFFLSGIMFILSGLFTMKAEKDNTVE